METQWRSKSPKSAAPASSSRSREPTCPDRSGKTAASSGRSGERASSAAAHREDRVGRMWRRRIAPASSSRSRESISPDRSGKTAASSGRSGDRASSFAAARREDGVGRMRRRRIERGDGSPSSGEETTALRSKHWRKKQRRGNAWHWIPRRLLCKFNGDVKAALEAYAEEEGNARAALKGTEGETISQNDGTILKQGACLNDEELLMDQCSLHANRSSSQAGDAQEEAPFDQEETYLLLKMDKKPKPCSGDPGKIAQDEDEDEDGYSDKKPVTVVEDEHSGKIGAHATDEDHKQEQGRARGNAQDLLNMDSETLSDKSLQLDLLNMDSETLSDKIRQFGKLLNYDPPLRDYNLALNDDQLIELHEQLALYRIRAYELKVNRKLDKLDDVDLKEVYPLSTLRYRHFFKHYEESLEWYFDPDLCWEARFDNYQRLALRYDRYMNWPVYRSIRNTYEEDLAYIQYFEALANKTKWIEDYLGDSTIKRDKIRGVAYMQSLETAAGFPNVSRLLVFQCFNEYFSSICFDYSDNRLCTLYFKIWKLLAKGKMSFEEALPEVNELENTGKLSLRKDHEEHYDARVAGIDKMASDDEARQSIREAIIRMDPKPKYYIDYARKKLDIANEIGLFPRGPKDGKQTRVPYMAGRETMW